MFGWLRSKKEKAPFAGRFQPSMAADLIEDYGEILEKHAGTIIDSNWLPATKLVMIQAFKVAWLATNDPALRNHLEVGWVSLSNFQDRVGDHPIGCDTIGLEMKAVSALLERYIPWSKLSIAEGETLLADLNAFKAANPN